MNVLVNSTNTASPDDLTNFFTNESHPRQLDEDNLDVVVDAAESTVTAMLEEPYDTSDLLSQSRMVDLLMLEHVITADDLSGTEQASSIHDLTRQAAAHRMRPPFLTYGDLVLINNRASDRRTFLHNSDGDAARDAEVLFYQKYSEAERHLLRAHDQFRKLGSLVSLETPSDGIFETSFKVARALGGEALDHAKFHAQAAYNSFSDDQYNRWRQYLAPQGIEGPLPGIEYSPGYILTGIDVALVNGDMLPEDFQPMLLADHYGSVVKDIQEHGGFENRSLGHIFEQSGRQNEWTEQFIVEMGKRWRSILELQSVGVLAEQAQRNSV